MKINPDSVEISIDTWNEMKTNPMFIELIEFLEDREDLLQAIEEDKSDNGITLEELEKELGLD
jgi:hypothetical protein